MEEIGELVVVRVTGEDAGRMPLAEELTIGREEECDVRIRLPAVSRLQARLKFDGGHVSILCGTTAIPFLHMRLWIHALWDMYK